MAQKTKDIKNMAEIFIKKGKETKDMNLDMLLEELRKRKEYALLRQVIDKVRETGQKTKDDQELILLKAFAFFKDYNFSNSFSQKDREEGMDECLRKLDAEKSPHVEDFRKAIQRERDIQTARDLLKTKNPGCSVLLDYAKKLKGHNAFNYARRLFERLCLTVKERKGVPFKDKRQYRQQWAICTYKDPDLSLVQRLDIALDILNGITDHPDMNPISGGYLVETRDPKTLGLAGAIFKRKWEAEGRKLDLERSLYYYWRGHICDMKLVNHTEIAKSDPNSIDKALIDGIKEDHQFGYPGINATFVMDLLMHLEKNKSRSHRAQKIRQEITSYLKVLLHIPEEHLSKRINDNQWWNTMTLLEGYFGLKEYDEAAKEFPGVKSTEELWKFQSSARQLIQLVNLQGKNFLNANPKVKELLNTFLGGHLAAVENIHRGKVGLALSGGGFRAAFYHIGVLAKLAELDLLRQVEVISGVSGGSIIAAYYYLEVRKLLHSQEDSTISREQYIRIVNDVSQKFLKGTQKDFSLRIFSCPIKNLKMIFWCSYSRSVRCGELLEELLYSQVEDGEQDKPRFISSLYIEPNGEKLTFNPKSDNWLRKNKVPALVLNATSLNTGNNWQFTASWMGEPPPSSESELDGKVRLRRTYYHEAPKKHRQVRLGTAVAASSCVPGLFYPITLSKLYDNYKVRLVDGGVYDNQGISSLIDQGCTAFLISDGCGQLGIINKPRTWWLKPLFRSNMVTMERVRRAQFSEMDVRLRSGLVNNVMTVHLKKDLGLNSVDWFGCQDTIKPNPNPDSALDVTSYGVVRKIQNCLAGTRTHLDSFSDAEAYALMTSGYLMTEHTAQIDLKDILEEKYLRHRDANVKWDFLKVEEAMKDAEIGNKGNKHAYFKKILDLSNNWFFKSFKLIPHLKYLALFLLVSFISIVGYDFFKAKSISISWQSVKLSASFSLVIIISLASFILILVWLLLGIQRLIMNRIFLKRGRVKKIE